MTLGSSINDWTQAKAEVEVANFLADVRRGIWKPPAAEPSPIGPSDPTFHEVASEWLEGRRHEGLSARTIEDDTWALSLHLLPFFKAHRLSEITLQEVDRYKQAKAREGVLSPNSVNKTITRILRSSPLPSSTNCSRRTRPRRSGAG